MSVENPMSPSASPAHSNYFTIVPAYIFSSLVSTVCSLQREASMLVTVIEKHPGVALICSLFKRAAEILSSYYSKPPPPPIVNPLRDTDFENELRITPATLPPISPDLQLDNTFDALANTQSDPSIDQEAFETIFNSNTPPTAYVFDYFSNKYHMELPLKLSLLEESERRREITATIAKKDNHAILALAQKYQRDIRNLPTNKKLLFSINLSNSGIANLLKNQAASYLPAELQEILTEENKDKVAQNLYQKLSEFLHQEFGENSLLSECQTHIREMVRKAMEKTIGRLPNSFADAIKNSLKEDLREIAEERHLTNLWEMLSEEKLKKLVESSLSSVLKKLPTLLGDLEHLGGSLTNSIPSAVKELLGTVGLGGAEENIAIQVEKENSKYKITIFCNKSQTHNLDDGTAPLIYSGISENDLDDTFFYRFLSFGAFRDVTYTVDDVLALFNSLNVSFTQSNFQYPDINNKRDLLFFLLRFHLNLDEDTFAKDLFILQLKAILSIFRNNPLLRNDNAFMTNYRKAIDTFSSRANSLIQKGLLTKDDIKKTKLIIKHLKKQNTPSNSTVNAPNSSFLLPDFIRDFIKEFIPNNIIDEESEKFLKELFVDIFGEDVRSPLDLTLKEIKNELNQNVAQLQNHSPTSATWREIFSLKSVKDNLSKLKNMRISLLHTYRLFSKITYATYKFLEISIYASFLETLFALFLPPLSWPILLTISFMCVTYGPSILSKIVPKPIFDLLSLTTIYSNVINYLEIRLNRLFFKVFINYFLGSENISHVVFLLRDYQQKLTREGEIGFEINSPNIPHEDIRVLQMPDVPSVLPTPNEREEPCLDDEPLSKDTIKVTLDNLYRRLTPSLSFWPNSVQVEHKLYYLNQQIRRLPIPKKNDPLWSQVQDKKEILETLYLLSLKLVYLHENLLSDGKLDVCRHTETTVSIHALYAIIDYLARFCLSDFDDSCKANGCNLAAWANNPSVTIENTSTSAQLFATLEYFDFDPKKRYSMQEIDRRRKECLFNYENSRLSKFLFCDDHDYRCFYPGDRTISPTKEDRFYLNLLKNPKLQEILRLELGENASEHDKFFYLFTNPSLRIGEKNACKIANVTESSELGLLIRLKVEKLRQAYNSDNLDSAGRNHLLPISFSALRDMYFDSTEITLSYLNTVPEWDSRETSLSFTARNNNDGNPSDRAVTKIDLSHPLEIFSKVEESIYPPTPLRQTIKKIRRVFQIIGDGAVNVFHRVTLNKLRRKTFNIPHGITDSSTSQLLIEHAVVRASVTRSDNQSSRPAEILSTIAKLFSLQMTPALASSPRDETQILRHPEELNTLTEPQRKVFEMIYSNKSDQVMRTIAFFTQNLILLQDRHWRAIFKILIKNIGALESQLDDELVTKAIANFFKTAINFYISLHHDAYSSWDEVALDLISVSSWCKKQCFLKDRRALEYFPSERELILEKIIPAIRKKFYPDAPHINEKILLALIKLAHCHIDSPLTDDVIVDLCRVFYSTSKLTFSNNTEENDLLNLFWRIKPRILSRLEDPNLKRRVVEAILQDISMPLPPMYNGIWSGNFPKVSCNGLSLDFENITIQKRRTFQNYLANFFIKTGPITPLSNTSFYYPLFGVYCDCSSRLKITQIKNGKTYTLIKTDESIYEKLGFDQKILIWVEDTNRATFDVEFSYTTHPHFIENRRFTGRWSEINGEKHLELFGEEVDIDSTRCRLIDLEKNKHKLSLLSWFVPLSEIKAYLDIAKGVIKRLVISSLRLVFDVKTVNGASKAYSELFPGYYIDNIQRDGLLAMYPKHLILTNDRNEKKVIVLTESLNQLCANFLLNKANLSTPLIQKLLNLSFQVQGQEYFVYDYKDGILSSSNLEALTFLLLLNVITNKTQELKENLKALEDLSKCYPFPEKVNDLLDILNAFLLINNDNFSLEMALKISALRTENELVQHGKTRKRPLLFEMNNEFNLLQLAPLLEFFLLQKSYLYHIEMQKSQRAFLSEYEELLIIKRLSSIYSNFFEILTSHRTGVMLEILISFGIDNIANAFLMPKEVYERFQYLQRKYGERSFLLKAQQLFNQASNLYNEVSTLNSEGLFSSLAKKVIGSPRSFRSIAMIIAHQFAKFQFHPLHRVSFDYFSFHDSFVSKLDTSEQTLKTLPVNLWEMTSENIKRYFVLYYQLARKEMPTSWTNTANQQLFNEKAKTFAKTLSLLTGNYSGELKYLIGALIGARSNDTSFPTAGALIAAVDRVKYALRMNSSNVRPSSSVSSSSSQAHSVSASSSSAFAGISTSSALPSSMGSIPADFSISAPLFSSSPQVHSVSASSSSAADASLGISTSSAIPASMGSIPADSSVSAPLFSSSPQPHSVSSFSSSTFAGISTSSATANSADSTSEASNDHICDVLANDFVNGIDSKKIHSHAKEELFDTVMKQIFISAKKNVTCINLFNRHTVKLIATETAKRYGLSAIMNLSGIGFVDWIYRLRNVPSLIWRYIWPISPPPPAQSQNEIQIPAQQDQQFFLSPILAQHLSQRERNIDDFFSFILGKYFNKNPLPQTSSIRVPPLREMGRAESERDTFQKLNEDLSTYYSNRNSSQREFQYEFIGDKVEFFFALEDLKHLIQNRIQAEKKLIVQLANSIETDNLHEEYTFEEIFSLFARNKENELLNQGFPREKIDQIRESIYLLLVLSSRFNLIFDKYEELIGSSRYEELGFYFDQRRVYNFGRTDERFLRANLLFENSLKVLVREKQYKQLQKLLSSERSYNFVLEAIMASGKTFYMIPLAAEQKRDNIVFNVFPDDVFHPNLISNQRQSRMAFDQRALRLHCDRNTSWLKPNLEALINALRNAKEEHSPIVTSPSSLQCFQLQFLEKLFNYSMDPHLWDLLSTEKSQLDAYRQALALTRKALANIDEPHVTLADPKKELIFPLGIKKRLPTNYVNLIEEIMYLLISSREFENILTVKSKNPSSLHPEIYRRSILPILARKIAIRLDLSPANIESFIAYLLSQERAVPEFVLNHPKKRLLGLIKGVLTVILPSTLQNIIHCNYGISRSRVAQPARGNLNIVENTNFRNPFEALVKTYLLFLNEGLTDSDLDEYIRSLKDLANKQARTLRCFPQETPSAKKFEEITGYNIFSFTESNRRTIFDNLRKSDFVKLNFVSHIIAEKIDYYPKNLGSNGYTLSSMFKDGGVHSFDGSPHKTGAFPLNTRFLLDSGIKGQSLDAIQNCCNSIHVLRKSDPSEVLDELTSYFNANPHMTAFIDRGALCNGLENETVARKLLGYITEHRADMDGVVFFNKQKELMILEKGSREPISLRNSRIPKERRITYFDESHTYAADIAQRDDAVGIISIGESLTLEDLFQAIWRLRKLGKQTFIFVMTSTVKNLISPNRDVTKADIVEFAAQNENRINAEYNYFAMRQKISNYVRSLILDKILFAENIDQSMAIFNEFKSFLIEKVEYDPFELYGGIEEMVSPIILLKKHKAKLLNIIESSSTFTSAEKLKARNDLESIPDEIYPETIHTHAQNGRSAHEDLNREVQVQTNNSTEIATETDTDNDINRQYDLGINKDERPPSFWKWPSDIIPHDLTSWLHVSSSTPGFISAAISTLRPKPKVLIYSLKEALRSQSDAALQRLSTTISPKILASCNMLQIAPSILSSKVAPFSKYQKFIFEVLVIKQNNQTQILLLDTKEAAYWREKLSEDRRSANSSVKLALYDIFNQTVVASGKIPFAENELENDEEFQNAITQLSFFNGQVRYTERQRTFLNSWIRRCGASDMEDTFRRCHEDRGLEGYSGSAINEMFSLQRNHPLIRV